MLSDLTLQVRTGVRASDRFKLCWPTPLNSFNPMKLDSHHVSASLFWFPGPIHSRAFLRLIYDLCNTAFAESTELLLLLGVPLNCRGRGSPSRDCRLAVCSSGDPAETPPAPWLERRSSVQRGLLVKDKPKGNLSLGPLVWRRRFGPSSQ